MEKFSRSKSSREPNGVYPSSMHDLRSYSTSGYNPSQSRGPTNDNFKQMEMRKENYSSKSGKFASSSRKNWNFTVEPELQRKTRVAGYKAYGVEDKMKRSVRKSFRWVKDLVHGFL